MLSLAACQSTAFVGATVVAPSKLSPQMMFDFGKKAAPKAKPAFAYGLPGNFNALGGSELNWDPAGFLEVRVLVDSMPPPYVYARTLKPALLPHII